MATGVYELYSEGRAHLAAGEWLAAIPPLEVARDREPDKASIREALAVAYLRARRFADAEREAERHVDLDPHDDYGYYLLGRARLGLGRTARARGALKMACWLRPQDMNYRRALAAVTETDGGATMEKVDRTDAEWRAALTPEQYRILREKGTEAPWSGALNDVKEPGVFRCAGCGTELFRTDAKFESGSGWPSFYEPSLKGVVDYHDDVSHGMRRTEVTCASCGGHLGHVFPDGPQPTGLRYCINSCALAFDEEQPAG